jgi:hypothetical protein
MAEDPGKLALQLVLYMTSIYAATPQPIHMAGRQHKQIEISQGIK